MKTAPSRTWPKSDYFPSVLPLIGLNRPTLAHVGRIGSGDTDKELGGRDVSEKLRARRLPSMKRETKAGIGLVSLILAIIVLPNPYGTWLVALVIVIAMVLGGMSMANSDNWLVGLVIAVIVTVGLLLMVFIGSGGGSSEVP